MIVWCIKEVCFLTLMLQQYDLCDLLLAAVDFLFLNLISYYLLLLCVFLSLLFGFHYRACARAGVKSRF
jgi:hypothetical protein